MIKKKVKLKYPKHQSLLPAGFGSSSVNLFKVTYGINTRITAKRFLKQKKIKSFFTEFTQSGILNKPSRAYLPFYSYKQQRYSFLVFLKALQNYRALRHLNKLPVRGQRSKTNAKTCSKRLSTRRKKKVLK